MRVTPGVEQSEWTKFRPSNERAPRTKADVITWYDLILFYSYTTSDIYAPLKGVFSAMPAAFIFSVYKRSLTKELSVWEALAIKTLGIPRRSSN